MATAIKIIDHSQHIENLLARYRDVIGGDYAAYRGHVYRVVTYAMHFLRDDERYRHLVETAFVYHDIALWAKHELAYLEPSEEIALTDNRALDLQLDPDLLRAAIRWHHKVTPYQGVHADVVNAVRKADWIDATQGNLRKRLSREEVAAVENAIPNHGFPDVLQRLAKELGGSAVRGNLRVLRHVFRW